MPSGRKPTAQRKADFPYCAMGSCDAVDRGEETTESCDKCGFRASEQFVRGYYMRKYGLEAGSATELRHLSLKKMRETV